MAKEKGIPCAVTVIFLLWLSETSAGQSSNVDVPANVALDVLRGRVGAFNAAEITNLTATAVPGVSYPNGITVLPEQFSFTCQQVHQPGYYADVELKVCYIKTFLASI